MPEAVQVRPRHVVIESVRCATLAVVGYPAEVSPGWLQPLLDHPAEIDVAVYVEPVPAAVGADRLRRQLARLESTRQLDARHGRLVDPQVDAAAEDARDLASRLARGEGRLFRVGLYVTVRAGTDDELHAEIQRVRAVLSSLLLEARPATYRSLQGWLTALPVGIDLLRQHRTFDTAALAAAFPFASAELPTTDGVLYGRNARGGGLVLWDRFAQPNHNAVVLARSGAGKSYFAKLEVLRSLYRGIDVAVVDPEDEYRRLADEVGGTHIPLGEPGVRLNPLDLGDEPDALTRRGLFLHTLIRLLAGDLDGPTAAALDRGIVAAYNAVGITAEQRTWGRPAPLLGDLARQLEEDREPAGPALASRLAPYVTGTHRHLFDGPTSTRPDGHLVVFSLRALPEETKAAGTLLTLDAVWRRVTDPGACRPRLVVVDEAWLLMRDPQGAHFLQRLAKSARKHWCGLTVVTQDPGDLLATELGRAVVANAATQILLRQSPQTIDQIGSEFGLSDGERAFLTGAQPGEGILASGAHRVAFRAVASPAEHRLATSSPAELEQDDDR